MYLLPFAAMAMASCSNSDDAVIEQSAAQQLASSDQLIIRPAIGNATTRGISLVTGNLNEFHLHASGSFVEGNMTNKLTTTVTDISADMKKDANGNWPLTVGGTPNTQYWWGDGTANFQAWYPTGMTFVNNQYDVTIPAKKGDQSDILVAYNTGDKETFKDGVPLNFQHVTSQIIVKAKNEDADKVDIKIKAVRMVNLNNKGRLTLPAVATNKTDFWGYANASNSQGYTPWSAKSGTQTFGTYQTDGGTTTFDGNGIVGPLTSVATDIYFGDPFFMLPNQLTAATLPSAAVIGDYTTDLTELKKLVAYTWNKNLEGNAIAFLIQVKSKETGVTGDDVYIYPDKISEDENTITIGGTAYKLYGATSTSETDLSTTTIPTVTDDSYAWAYVEIDTNWEPGKKYTYTINFSKDAYGKIDPNQEPDGVKPPKVKRPGDPVSEKAVPLTFIVTVEDWYDVPNEDLIPAS